MYSNASRPIQTNRPPQHKMVATRPTCWNYSKLHSGKCLMGTNTCFKCGKVSNMARECPALVVPLAQVANLGQKKLALARVFALTMNDLDASNDVMTSILPLFLHRICNV